MATAVVLAIAGSPGPVSAAETSISIGPGQRVHAKLTSFKAMRDDKVVKQAYDYSCGAAALATLLTYGLDDPISERAILREILAALPEDEEAEREKQGLSLLDLQRAAQERGYRAQGFFVRPPLLDTLARPVIVFISPRDYDHFAVLKGVKDGYAFLADPSRGNVRMALHDFLPMWLDDEGKGIVFAVEPADGTTSEHTWERTGLAPPPTVGPRPELMSVRQMLAVGNSHIRFSAGSLR